MAAIYQWFPGQLLVATSTLYPVEADYGLVFYADIVGGLMTEWQEDSLTGGSTIILSANLEPILITYGTPEDSLTGGSTVLLAATLVDILITYGTPEDTLTAGVILLDATLVPKLVSTDSEDTGIVFSATIVAGSMETA